jgi:hypothetical protein
MTANRDTTAGEHKFETAQESRNTDAQNTISRRRPRKDILIKVGRKEAEKGGWETAT